MRNVTLREAKGSLLTFKEMDDNLIELGWNYVTITSNYNANARDFCLVDTTNSEITINLPDINKITIIKFLDIKGNFETNKLTVNRNGKQIMGLDEDLICDRDNDRFDLIYINGDWRVI